MGEISSKTQIIHNEFQRLKHEVKSKDEDIEMLKKVILELQKNNVELIKENMTLKKIKAHF